MNHDGTNRYRFATGAVALVIGCASPSEPSPAKCQTAAIGMAECIEDADCQRELDSWLEGMAGPRVPRERTITVAHCTQLTILSEGGNYGPGPACQCQFEGGGSLSVGPEGVGCLAHSRTGNCIWEGSAFPGCDFGKVSNCPEFCDQLLEKLREDDLRVFETDALGAVCEGFNCRSLAQVDDQCFLNMRNAGPAPCDPELLSTPEPTVNECPSDMDAGPQREYHPRPENEWQGMRVRVDRQAICDGKASCSFALACKDGVCGPCLADADCAGGEVCVLDHCVLQENVSCRSYTDCDEGSLCILSGYSGGYRNNEDMRAHCLSPDGGTPQTSDDLRR